MKFYVVDKNPNISTRAVEGGHAMIFRSNWDGIERNVHDGIALRFPQFSISFLTGFQERLRRVGSVDTESENKCGIVAVVRPSVA